MSWSVSMIGTPAAIVKALDRESKRLAGQSKQEFDDALPHLKALVEQNVKTADDGYPVTVSLVANGHANFKDSGGGGGAVKTYGSVNVTLAGATGNIVVE